MATRKTATATATAEPTTTEETTPTTTAEPTTEATPTEDTVNRRSSMSFKRNALGEYGVSFSMTFRATVEDIVAALYLWASPIYSRDENLALEQVKALPEREIKGMLTSRIRRDGERFAAKVEVPQKFSDGATNVLYDLYPVLLGLPVSASSNGHSNGHIEPTEGDIITPDSESENLDTDDFSTSL